MAQRQGSKPSLRVLLVGKGDIQQMCVGGIHLWLCGQRGSMIEAVGDTMIEAAAAVVVVVVVGMGGIRRLSMATIGEDMEEVIEVQVGSTMTEVGNTVVIKIKIEIVGDRTVKGTTPRGHIIEIGIGEIEEGGIRTGVNISALMIEGMFVMMVVVAAVMPGIVEGMPRGRDVDREFSVF